MGSYQLSNFFRYGTENHYFQCCVRLPEKGNLKTAIISAAYLLVSVAVSFLLHVKYTVSYRIVFDVQDIEQAEGSCHNIHLYSPERQQQQVKKHQTYNNNKTNKREKNYAQSGRTNEQCYHIYTPTNSKNIC